LSAIIALEKANEAFEPYRFLISEDVLRKFVGYCGFGKANEAFERYRFLISEDD